jgi:mono/diheme cytochrome c family protein
MGKSLLVLTLSLAAVVAALVVVSINPSTSVAQNTNSSQNTNGPTTTNRNDTRSISPQPPSAAAPQQDFSKNTWELPADADKTKNPVASSPESIAKGKELYLDRMKGNCVFCHGETGSGNEANLARLRRKPADISNKERMAAMTDGELFWKISKGITGIMPAGERRMSEEERWHVVNYIRTLPKAE